MCRMCTWKAAWILVTLNFKSLAKQFYSMVMNELGEPSATMKHEIAPKEGISLPVSILPEL